MKKKKILLTMYIAFFACWANAQRIDVQQVFVATSEQEMYRLYNQMLDSARLSNKYLYYGDLDRFGFSYLEEIESKDTLIIFKQRCDEKSFGYICDRFYWVYISNSMSIDFYERLLNYFKEVEKRENYFLKGESTAQLWSIMDIIIKQYESGKLTKEDSVKVPKLIEEALLRLVNDDHNYRGLSHFDKYMTDKIRQALVNVLENPFYPKEYLDFYMSYHVDTLSLDTVGIPDHIKKDYRKKSLRTEETSVYYERLDKFFLYERIGEIEGGLSPVQAHLKVISDRFREQGYLPISYIEKYAYKKQDKLLIKHLKEFKKKHPDYPLKYF